MRTTHSNCTSIQDLSKLLPIDPNKLQTIVRTRNHYYKREEKLKPDGRKRILHKPQGELKRVQRLLHSKWLNQLPLHDLIHSYRKKRSQLSNAKPHVGNPYMIKLDIKDFFPSIGSLRVYNLFRELNCSSSVARLLSLLTTYENQLPQGAPTSPAIANQILIPLAKRVNGLCSKLKLDASIFADDITISGAARSTKVKNLLINIIRDEGFSINTQKVKIFNPRDKKTVTGVVVNKKTNIDKEYYRQLKAIIHNCSTKGPGTQFTCNLEKAKNQILGKINHVKKFNPQRGNKLLEEFTCIKWVQ